MQLAFIPPIDALSMTEGQALHLMLPQHIDEPEYRKHFLKMRRLGKRIMLDNGANENFEISDKELVKVAGDYFVNELVLPDTMGDFYSTLGKALDFLGQHRLEFRKEVEFGFVLHGRTYYEAINHFDTLRANQKLFEQINVIYLPRMMVQKEGDRIRINVADYIFEQEPRFNKHIHLLGANPLWMMECREAYKLADGAKKRFRSMDTSAPFVYAKRDKYIDEGVYRRDEASYFYGPMSVDQRLMARENMEAMQRWVGVR